MCGTRHWHQVYRIINETGEELAQASEAISCINKTNAASNVLQDGNEQLIKFSDGVLLVRI